MNHRSCYLLFASLSYISTSAFIWFNFFYDYCSHRGWNNNSKILCNFHKKSLKEESWWWFLIIFIRKRVNSPFWITAFPLSSISWNSHRNGQIARWGGSFVSRKFGNFHSCKDFHKILGISVLSQLEILSIAMRKRTWSLELIAIGRDC